MKKTFHSPFAFHKKELTLFADTKNFRIYGQSECEGYGQADIYRIS